MSRTISVAGAVVVVTEVAVADVVLVGAPVLVALVALAVLFDVDEAVGAADEVVPLVFPDDFAPSSPLLQPATERLSVNSTANQNFFKIYPLSRSEGAAPVRLV